jgi:hypothetical protein
MSARVPAASNIIALMQGLDGVSPSEFLGRAYRLWFEGEGTGLAGDADQHGRSDVAHDVEQPDLVGVIELPAFDRLLLLDKRGAEMGPVRSCTRPAVRRGRP